MDYHSLRHGVLGLPDVFKMDLMKHLETIMSPQAHCDVVNCIGTGENEYWASIRSDAFDDFKVNGIDQELDEVDMYQSRLRELFTTRPIEPENPMADAYMNLKRRKSKKKVKTVCVFCRNNNEQPQVFQSHILKDSDGRVTCPILRKYTCPLCGVSGDNAHTIRYCPRNIEKELNTGILMLGPRLSTGKINPRCQLAR